MNDLGKITYEDKRHFFNRFTVHHIVINPKVEGYPPLFLICRDRYGHSPCEYAVGTTFQTLNRLLMRHAAKEDRINVAAALGHALSDPCHRGIIRMRAVAGKALTLEKIAAETTVCRFCPEPESGGTPLYFFRLSEVSAT